MERRTFLGVLAGTRGSAYCHQPVVYPEREYVDAGGLVSYGPNVRANFYRAATYVDRILKGTRPGNLPIEEPSTFELIVNIETAKALGVTIPRSLLLRADQSIE
jgi:putative tryptophan/tyrosine transport system substrate-binding protein